jgi:hypothetical protein
MSSNSNNINLELNSGCGLFINENNKKKCFDTCNNWILDLVDSLPSSLVKPNSSEIYYIIKSDINFNDVKVDLNRTDIDELKEEFEDFDGKISTFYILKRLSKLYLSDILYVREKLKNILPSIVEILKEKENLLTHDEAEYIIKNGNYPKISNIINLLDTYISVHESNLQRSVSANNLVNIIKLYYACYTLQNHKHINKQLSIILQLDKPYFASTTEIGEFKYKKTPTRENFFLNSNWIIDGDIIQLSLNLKE